MLYFFIKSRYKNNIWGIAMSLKLKYLLNRNLKEHSEKVFEGISNGRKRHWITGLMTSGHN